MTETWFDKVSFFFFWNSDLFFCTTVTCLASWRQFNLLQKSEHIFKILKLELTEEI